MTPIVIDPEPTASAGATIAALAESGLAYGFTLILGWIVSQLFVGKRLKKHEEAMKDQHHAQRDELAVSIEDLGKTIASIREEILLRVEKNEHAHQSVAQEVWGAHETNGIRGDVKLLKDEVSGYGRALSSIDAKMEILLQRHS